MQERDAASKHMQTLEMSASQAESDKKMQIDRANERLKSYERALFDTRQVSCFISRDGRINEGEQNEWAPNHDAKFRFKLLKTPCWFDGSSCFLVRMNCAACTQMRACTTVGYRCWR
jgi:hypothetical protein